MRNTILGLAMAGAVLALAGCNDDTRGDQPAATPSVPASPAPGAGTPDPAPSPAEGTPAPPVPAPGDTVPARFQGSYASDAAACADPAHESRLAIAADSIQFHESSGPITKVSSGEDEISLTARLTGESETRDASYSFRLSDDGGTLTDVGGGMVRHRCG